MPPRAAHGLRGMGLALLGVGMGLVGALALNRVMTNVLFGVSTADPATFTGVTMLLIGIAFLACFVPARRERGLIRRYACGTSELRKPYREVLEDVLEALKEPLPRSPPHSEHPLVPSVSAFVFPPENHRLIVRPVPSPSRG